MGRFRRTTADTARRWATAREMFITWRRRYFTMRRHLPHHFRLEGILRCSKGQEIPTTSRWIRQSKLMETSQRCHLRPIPEHVQCRSPWLFQFFPLPALPMLLGTTCIQRSNSWANWGMPVSFNFLTTLTLFFINLLLFPGMIPSPPPRNAPRYHPQPHNLADMARIHRMGRAYSHEGVIDSSLGDIGIYYNPDEDGSLIESISILLTNSIWNFLRRWWRDASISCLKHQEPTTGSQKQISNEYRDTKTTFFSSSFSYHF